MRLQLKDPLSSGDLAKILGKISAGDEVPNANKLDPLEDLSHYFPEPPVKKMIHLVVQLPQADGENFTRDGDILFPHSHRQYFALHLLLYRYHRQYAFY